MSEIDDKPGWKTSEFWTTIGTTLINVLAMTGMFTAKEAGELMQVIPIISGSLGQAIITMSYVFARSKVKLRG